MAGRDPNSCRPRSRTGGFSQRKLRFLRSAERGVDCLSRDVERIVHVERIYRATLPGPTSPLERFTAGTSIALSARRRCLIIPSSATSRKHCGP
jgi:hypothetical protein